MAINYCKTIFPLAESCRNSCGIHVICTNEHTMSVCRIEFVFFVRNKHTQKIVKLQQAIHLEGIHRKFGKRKHKHSVEGLSSSACTYIHPAPTFILHCRHRHSHTTRRFVDSVVRRERKKNTKNTIQLSAMLFRCFVNNGSAINRTTVALLHAGTAKLCARARMKAATNMLSYFEPKNGFFFSYFSLRVESERDIALCHELMRAKWLLPKWPLHSNSATRQPRVCASTRVSSRK